MKFFTLLNNWKQHNIKNFLIFGVFMIIIRLFFRWVFGIMINWSLLLFFYVLSICIFYVKKNHLEVVKNFITNYFIDLHRIQKNNETFFLIEERAREKNPHLNFDARSFITLSPLVALLMIVSAPYINSSNVSALIFFISFQYVIISWYYEQRLNEAVVDVEFKSEYRLMPRKTLNDFILYVGDDPSWILKLLYGQSAPQRPLLSAEDLHKQEIRSRILRNRMSTFGVLFGIFGGLSSFFYIDIFERTGLVPPHQRYIDNYFWQFWTKEALTKAKALQLVSCGKLTSNMIDKETRELKDQSVSDAFNDLPNSSININ